MSDGLTDRLVEVENWLSENVSVITHANELTLCDFTYNPKNYSGKFSVSVDGEALEERWRFWLGDADGWPTVSPPMFTSPLGAPASYAAVKLSDDPLLFGPNLLDEYELCRNGFRLNDQLIATLARASFEHSGAPAEVKAAGVQALNMWLN